MSTEITPAAVSPGLDHPTEAAMLRALGSILRSGTLCAERVETLAAATSDATVDEAGRRFASQSLRWLAQQSAMVTTPIWQRSSDAQH